MSCNIIVSGIVDHDRENDDASSDYSLDDTAGCWSLIPEPVFLKILNHLTARDILQAGECCRRWNDISRDDFLWKKVFQRDFKVDRTIGLKPGTFV